MIKRVLVIVGVLLLLGVTAVVAVAIWPPRTSDEGSTSATARHGVVASDGGSKRARQGSRRHPTVTVPPDITRTITISRFALLPVTGPLPVHYRFKHPPVAGVLFDVKSGQGLWQRNPDMERPIASLTKMMTALMVARADPPNARVKVSRNAAHTQGSATGLLPRGRSVPLEALLQALILISANDAAVALAEYDAGSVPRFVKGMNTQAQAMGLHCTHFTTPNGLRDRG